MHELFRDLPFPYPDNVFPDNLGVVVQATIVKGEEPIRVVVHDEDGDWLFGDDINDPNLPGASIVSCVSHLVEADPSIAELASMPIGTQARRYDPEYAWEFTAFDYEDEDEL